MAPLCRPQKPEAYYASVSHFDAYRSASTAPCVTGCGRISKAWRAIARFPISCYPNAGMPDGFGGFTGTKEQMVAAMHEVRRNGWVNIVGGCCAPRGLDSTPSRGSRRRPPRRHPRPPPRVVLLQRVRVLTVRPKRTSS